MLIDFKKAVRQYHMNIDGVIHVGAHHAQEHDDYVYVGANQFIYYEPCEKAFAILHERFKNNDRVLLYNHACGSMEGRGTMHTETANTGMSNSLLRPALHLLQHPTIHFNGTENVRILPLDRFPPGPEFNLLVMDCQGYEGEVLRGGMKTLENIDYVYTEVNRAEVYENCARIEEIDALLSAFARVSTKWAGNWGDAIYIRKSLLK